MRTIARPFLVAAFALCLVLGLAWGRPQETPSVKAEAVNGSVSMLVGYGGNIGVSAGPDGVLIVDDQFERLVPLLEEQLSKLAGGQAVPRFLINTHHHDDHTGANAHFGKRATVIAHANVRARLLDARVPKEALPVVTHDDGMAVHWNGEEIRLLYVPEAHTDGDTVVWFTGSNVVHMGDLYFELGYPFVDVENGGNVLGLAAGLRNVLAELPEDVRVIPGHGKVTGRAELQEYLEMIETIVERVREHLEAVTGAKPDGASMAKAGLTSDFDERWGGFDFVPPERFLQSVLDSLQ